MLKKISTTQLRPGMHVHELCGSWMDTPFWQKSFTLSSDDDLKKIVESGIKEAWIDTSKGRDIDEAGHLYKNKSADASPSTAAPQAAVSGDDQKIKPATLQEEFGRASRIVSRSREAVFAMFNEARMGKAVDVSEAKSLVEEISLSIMRNPNALIGLARLKSTDDYTYMHSVAVCALMVALAKQLGLSKEQTRDAGMAGLMHDIGKMAVDQSILNKPGRLTDEEFVAMKLHPQSGHQILLQAGITNETVLEVCLHHHEKIDGTGYPHGLKGDQISLYTRMGAICDIYDAITSDRAYKSGWCPAESLRRMAEWCNGHLDEKVFQAFVKSIGIYPIGTLVRMTSGRLGIVVEQQAHKSLLTPKVRLFFSSKSMTYIQPELIDLSHPSTQDKIAGHENASKWDFKDMNRYWLEQQE